MPAQFVRETQLLTRSMGSYWGLGLHMGLRHRCDHEDCEKAYNVVHRLQFWKEMTGACGRTAVRYPLRTKLRKITDRHRDKLAWLLARRSLQICRREMWRERAKALHLNFMDMLPKGWVGEAMWFYDFLANKLTFANYRRLLEPVAVELLQRMCTPRDACEDCKRIPKRRAGMDVPCEVCHQERCPIHCRCATGEERFRASKTRRGLVG